MTCFRWERDQIGTPPRLSKSFEIGNLGGGKSTEFELCHHGQSPFAYFETDKAQRTQRDQYARAFNGADNQTVVDMLREEAEGEARCPMMKEGVRTTLVQYLCLGLIPRLGLASDWVTEVSAMVKALKADKMDDLDEDKCLTIMWHIFLESRWFFK